MIKLSERLQESCRQCKRSPYDLLRCIASLIPDDHPLASSAMRDLDSMAFSPPESLPMFFSRFLDDLSAAFPEPSFEDAPVWAKAISAIVLAGGLDRDEFSRWFNCNGH